MQQQMMLKARLADLLGSGRYRIDNQVQGLDPLVPWVRLSAGSEAANRANAAGIGGLLLDLQQFASEPSPSGRLELSFTPQHLSSFALFTPG